MCEPLQPIPEQKTAAPAPAKEIVYRNESYVPPAQPQETKPTAPVRPQETQPMAPVWPASTVPPAGLARSVPPQTPAPPTLPTYAVPPQTPAPPTPPTYAAPPQTPAPPTPPTYAAPPPWQGYGAWPTASAPPAARPDRGYDVAALVLGICGIAFFWTWLPALVCGVLALIFGLTARKRKASRQGLAIGGIATGIVTLVLVLWMTAFLILGIVNLAQNPDLREVESNDHWVYDEEPYQDGPDGTFVYPYDPYEGGSFRN